MDIYSLTDKTIAKELGDRLRALRLQRNVTQKELAEATTLSLNTIKALEGGRGKLATLIAVLRELGALEQLDALIPANTISPLQLARLQGRQRQRASGTRGRDSDGDESAW
ncbi:MAG: helix-turn-helix transcriptional regulator [Gammaproteobacteria bacterium]|jgi:transcriptional regulator with XRE-family HTH domain